MAHQDQEFLAEVVKLLVKNPKKVKVERLVNEKGVLLTINCDPEDIGTLIGKEGRNINALRHLTRMLGLRSKSFISIRLNQPEQK
jgi:predicted RNA-binding protein YlqC (UPF0109 family)